MVNASIDEVGVWNRALTQDEVTQLYNYGSQFESGYRTTDFNFRRLSMNGPFFEQPDTLIPNVYDPQTLNRYMFERGNPINKEDPSGHNAYVYVGVGAFLIGATGYWYNNPVDYDNPDWGNRFIKGGEHGLNWAINALLAMNLATNSAGRVIIGGVSLASIGKGSLAAVNQLIWDKNIDKTKTTPTEVATTAMGGAISSTIPGFSGSGQYAATSNLFTTQNYYMLNDYLLNNLVSSNIQSSLENAANEVQHHHGGGTSNWNIPLTDSTQGNTNGGTRNPFAGNDYCASHSSIWC